MTPPALIDCAGQPLALGERIGRGGEGEVYALANDREHAAKIYTVSDLGERPAKIAAMVAVGLAGTSQLVAFPDAVVRKRGGGFAGFTMHRVSGHKPLFELYAPGARKAAFPGADYRFLVRAAANVARAVGAVHAAGCVIGDINHSGLLVSSDAIVALIDADSFQFTAPDGTRYLCRVGVPEYTPPDLQGRPLAGVVRTEQHDRFGLAVVIFQLLFMGRHPFSGAFKRGEMPIERAIGEYRFAYSRERKVGMTPPPGSPTLGDFPAGVSAAFERAFSPATATDRPSPAEWIAVLAALERTLHTCPVDPLHHYPEAAGECPWCRLEQRLGISLFAAEGKEATPAIRHDPGAAGFDLRGILQHIEQVTPPPPAPDDPPLPIAAITMSERGRSTRGARRRRQSLGLVFVLMAAVARFGFGTGWPLTLLTAAFGVLLLWTEDAGTRALRRELRALDQRWDDALDDWEDHAGDGAFATMRDELRRAAQTYRDLPKMEAEKVAVDRRDRRSAQMRVFLRGFRVADAHIAEIDSSRLQTLTSYGIETAADVNEWALSAVPGLAREAVWHVMAWRRRLEGRFVYNKHRNTADQARLDAIHSDAARRAAELRSVLAGGVSALERLKQQAAVRRARPDPELVRLNVARLQTAADLRTW